MEKWVVLVVSALGIWGFFGWQWSSLPFVVFGAGGGLLLLTSVVGLGSTLAKKIKARI